MYEPNRAIIKAGLSAEYAYTLGLNMLAPNSHLFISMSPQATLISDFQGRKFQIIERIAYKPKEIIDYLKTNAISKANITIRNFRETTDELKKRYTIKDGGSHYLFFTTDNENQRWMFDCRAI